MGAETAFSTMNMQVTVEKLQTMQPRYYLKEYDALMGCS